MNVGDVIRFKLHQTSKPDAIIVGKVVYVFGHGVLRVINGDGLGTFQIWESQATLVSESEALLWKLEHL